MFAHYVLLFAPLLACRAPGSLSPVRSVSRLYSPQGRVSNDRVPRHPTPSTRQTPFHNFPGGPQYRRTSATPRPRCRLHEHTLLHAARILVFLSLFALRFYRVPIHMGNHAFASRFFHNTHAFGLSGFSLLCPRTLTSAQALTAAPETACIHINTVHHSTPYLRL